jgi:two-component system chemotaxis response regulator CheY
MKTLIVEDSFVSRVLMQEQLKSYGPTHIAVNGKEAVEAVRTALEANEPYDLICLDIMMPEMDGQQALKQIRGLEDARGTPASKRTKIIMTTALADQENVMEAVRWKCDYFLAKPLRKEKLHEVLRGLALIQ